MNDKEQLEDIRKCIKYLRGISVGDVEWLIEQCEDKQTAIERVDKIGKLALNREQDYKNLKKENEEYEQALKEIAKADSSNKLWKYIAIQALKGESDD